MGKAPQLEAFAGDKDTIRVVGHRGARGILPENSLLGFDFALSIGINLLEFDVLLTNDGTPVIFHNHRLHGSHVRGPDGAFLTGALPRISSLRIDEIELFDIGRLNGKTAYARRFPDQAQMDGIKIPKLCDVLALVSKPEHQNAYLMLELKSDPELADNRKARRKIVSAVCRAIYAAGLENRTLLHSFDWALLQECQAQAPDIPLSFLTQLHENKYSEGEETSLHVTPDLTASDISIPKEVSKAGGALWCPHFKELTAQQLSQARDLGLIVAVWTVNEPEEITAMIDLGVDAIISDYPGRVQRCLSDRGLRWEP